MEIVKDYLGMAIMTALPIYYVYKWFNHRHSSAIEAHPCINCGYTMFKDKYLNGITPFKIMIKPLPKTVQMWNGKLVQPTLKYNYNQAFRAACGCDAMQCKDYMLYISVYEKEICQECNDAVKDNIYRIMYSSRQDNRLYTFFTNKVLQYIKRQK